jgi:hypothetical protein
MCTENHETGLEQLKSMMKKKADSNLRNHLQLQLWFSQAEGMPKPPAQAKPSRLHKRLAYPVWKKRRETPPKNLNTYFGI